MFVFDRSRKLRFVGRIDDSDKPDKVKSHDTRNAIDAVLAGKPAPVATTKVFGCSIKWADKRDSARQSLERWAQEKAALEPIDEQPVWSISCLFVLKPLRRRGISAALLRAAVELARTRGARIVEGYPVVPTMAKAPDPFIWTGVPSSFERAGFREVLRRSRTRPIMRYEIDEG